MKLVKTLSFLFFILLTGCSPQDAPVQGYVDADYIYLSSPSSGLLREILVEKGQLVEKKALLFSLDAEPERQQLRQAQARAESESARLKDLESGKRKEEIAVLNAQLKQAQAALELAKSRYRRETIPFQKGHLAALDYDLSKSELQQKLANVEEIKRRITAESLPARKNQQEAQTALVTQAQAQLAQSEWIATHTSVKALSPARVFDIYYRAGEWVPAGSPVISLLPAENIKIRFFVSASQFARLQYGQSLLVTPLNGDAITAKITYLSPVAEYTPPLIYSNERNEKMLFLIEAKPEETRHIDNTLHPGMSVEITL